MDWCGDSIRNMDDGNALLLDDDNIYERWDLENDSWFAVTNEVMAWDPVEPQSLNLWCQIADDLPVDNDILSGSDGFVSDGYPMKPKFRMDKLTAQNLDT